MKIIIASTIVPMIEGGATFIVDWLEQKLREYGHQVDVLKIPFNSHYKSMISQILALRLYHLEDACDRLICIRMPSYLLKHPNKYIWFLHHYREIYDLWNTEMDYLPKNNEMLAIREYIMRADDTAFTEAKKIYTISDVCTERLKRFNDVKAETLYPPIFDPDHYYHKECGDYLFYPSRVGKTKRQVLVIEAFRFTKTDVKLIITGKGDNAASEKEIFDLIGKYHLHDKVRYINRFITEGEKQDYYAHALAVPFTPYEEDYGYITLEAFHSQKAVVTCTDSGQPRHFIDHGVNGYIVEPSPRALAETFDQLYKEKNTAAKMGHNALLTLSKLNINWNNVIERLTE